MATPPPAGLPIKLPAFDNTLGAGFIGCIVTTILYGVTCVQAFVFMQSGVDPNGPRHMGRIRWMVVVLWFIDTFHTILIIYSLYWYLVTNFANPLIVGEVRWSVTAEILVTPTSDTIVRLFFAWRIWVLSGKNKYMTYPVIILTFVIWALGIWFSVRAFGMTEFLQFTQISWLLYTGLSLLVVGDAYTAIILCILLRRARTGFSKTDSLVTLLMAYTVQTGAITSLFSMACLITFATMPKTYIFLAIHFPLSKLYLNACLATLNARNFVRNRNTTNNPPSVSAQSDSMGMNRVERKAPVFPGAIRVETVIQSDVQSHDEYVVPHPYSSPFSTKDNWA